MKHYSRLMRAPLWMLLIFISGWWSVASAAETLPSSTAAGAFSPWRNMHPSTFDLSVEAVREQCLRAVPTEQWLKESHCELLVLHLTEQQCQEVMVPDGTRLDRLLGRVDGGKGKSMPWARQEKQTGRLDRALLCDLGDGVHSYWFTGEAGKSCNNVAFVYNPLFEQQVVAAPTKPKGQWVCGGVPVGQAVQNTVSHQLEGYVLRNDCCCSGDLVVPSSNFELGSTVQSAGYTEQCHFQPE